MVQLQPDANIVQSAHTLLKRVHLSALTAPGGTSVPPLASPSVMLANPECTRPVVVLRLAPNALLVNLRIVQVLLNVTIVPKVPGRNLAQVNA